MGRSVGEGFSEFGHGALDCGFFGKHGDVLVFAVGAGDFGVEKRALGDRQRLRRLLDACKTLVRGDFVLHYCGKRIIHPLDSVPAHDARADRNGDHDNKGGKNFADKTHVVPPVP